MRLSTLVLIALIAGGLGLLSQRFPYITLDADMKGNLAYTTIILATLGSSLLLSYRGRGAEMVRHLLSWCAIIILVVTGYSYRTELLNSRFVSSIMPQRAIMNNDGTVTFRAANDGHFYMETTINGALVKFMVDTGASDITLSADDAQRAGFKLDELSYTRSYHTANGVVKGAPVMLDTIVVGPITMRNIRASVNTADMGTSLLGMEYFRHLRGFSVQGDVLTLQP